MSCRLSCHEYTNEYVDKLFGVELLKTTPLWVQTFGKLIQVKYGTLLLINKIQFVPSWLNKLHFETRCLGGKNNI